MVLDSEMKRLQATAQRKAEPITPEDEENLCRKRILGDSTLQSLIDTMLYINGFYFALRGRKEQYKPSQMHLLEKLGERPYLMYVEDLSNNHPSCLKGRKIKPKMFVIMPRLRGLRDFYKALQAVQQLVIQIMSII